jgi:hypothetical protein
MTKCIICDQRPSHKGNGFCATCEDKINSERKSRQPAKPSRYVTYRGHVVGMYPTGDGTLKPRLLGISAKRLPKAITLDLNHYLEGFNRATIKRLKATVLQLAHA